MLLLLLLFLFAFLSDLHPAIAGSNLPIAKLCLSVSSVLCALLSAGSSEEKHLLHALSGESILFFLVCIIGIICGFSGGAFSLLIDIGIMLFGAFAGTILCGSGQHKRRGKR